MGDVAIRVESLSKKFRIGSTERYRTFRDTLTDTLAAPFRFVRNGGSHKAPAETIWALKDVSFEVKHGEVIGIIGRNGAGKSTLLKILSRITEPTKGHAEIHGRVGSLLEVGTGFHPELTGRENIFLNGAILGMKKAEILRRFDEIVAFAEVEKFIDTAVKHYSTGMYVRLAFAVAAHLEPEVLIIDEVLAVGDMAFQRKCLGRINDAAGHGKTVIFVSHNMAAVKSLCKTALMLDEGEIAAIGTAAEVVGYYLGRAGESESGAVVDVTDLPRTRGNGGVHITRAMLTDGKGAPASSFAVWEPMVVHFEAEAPKQPQSAAFWLLVRSVDGETVLSAFQYDSGPPVQVNHEPRWLRVTIDPNILAPGVYSMTLGAFGTHREIFEWVDNVCTATVRNEFSTGKPYDYRFGTTTLSLQWDTIATPEAILEQGLACEG